MKFFRRAIISVWRRSGKSTILFLLLFVLSSIMVGGISIRRAIHLTEENLLRNLPSLVTIEWDFMRFTENVLEWQANDDWNWASDWQSTADRNDPSTFPSQVPYLPTVSPADIRAIGASEYVRSFDYNIFTRLHSFELEPYGNQGLRFSPDEQTAQFFYVRGTSQPNLIQFEQGLLELIQGYQFSETDLISGQEHSVALISVPFAQVNNLTIGSFVSLYHFVMYPDEHGNTSWARHEDEVYEAVGMEFEVVGLFDLPASLDVESDTMETDLRLRILDTIFIPNWTIEDISYRTNLASRSVWDEVDMEMPFSVWWDLGGPRYQEEATLKTLIDSSLTYLFMLDNPSDMDVFRATTEALLPEYHYFVDLSYTIGPIVSSMEFMREIADWIFYGSIIATLIVFTLLILLFLRDRREEIATYLALGEKKIKVISQIMLETLMISLMSFTLGLFIGTFISRGLSQTLLENEIFYRFEENQNRYVQAPRSGIGTGQAFEQAGIIISNLTPEEMMDSFDMSLSMETVAIFYTVGLGTILLSTALPILYATKLEPKKILM